MKRATILIPLIALLPACQATQESPPATPAATAVQDCDCEATPPAPSPAPIQGRVEKVLTAEEQAALTPDTVIELLKEGNERFMSNSLTARDHSAQVRKSAAGQFPKAIVLSCVDSRVPVEDVFDRGIGDIFVARVAGNFVNEDILGSMEFATKAAGAKLVLVMGHEHCGAVKSAIDGVEIGNITPMLDKIEPAIEMTTYEGERVSSNPDFVHAVCENNVKNTVDAIRERSEILRELEQSGTIKILGAIYDLDSGKVTFFEP